MNHTIKIILKMVNLKVQQYIQNILISFSIFFVEIQTFSNNLESVIHILQQTKNTSIRFYYYIDITITIKN